MALHFDREEFAARRQRALEAMAAQGLDALLRSAGEERFLAIPCGALRRLTSGNS
jgi:hypothetical protein